jgi:hypothetical protein
LQGSAHYLATYLQCSETVWMKNRIATVCPEYGVDA